MSDGAAIGARLSAPDIAWGAWLREAGSRLRRGFETALETEASQRRFFLWLPVAAGAGVVLYFVADREPSLWYAAGLALGTAMLAFLLRRWPLPFAVALLAAAVTGGFL